MSSVRINSIKIKNYRSFGDEQSFVFPDESYKKPIAIVGYNNAGKTNLMNSMLYALQVNYVGKDTFSVDDFHNRDMNNVPKIELFAESSVETKYDGKNASLNGKHILEIKTDGREVEGSSVKCYDESGQNYAAFGATRYFSVFNINFHNIKEEISTQKTSWGNLKSFLAKHIKNIVEGDEIIQERKNNFQSALREASKTVMEGEANSPDKSRLAKFIERIKDNYQNNLREKSIDVGFNFPEFEDIFLHMMFKIGLNGDNTKMVPIEHFGDGYVSMFVMAVLLAIAEENVEDRCLFLFEEPESFLHENHQEYFYKNVLCVLAEKGHQVIYTTHSDKMVDLFDTKGLIRLEIENGQTIKKYNKVEDFNPEINLESGEIVTYDKYNEFVKTIEPNFNRILFSHKAILVEGPNDLLVYKYVIQKRIEEILENIDIEIDKKKYAETYLNFRNFVIIPHHGKTTAIYLAQICKWFGLDCFLVNDWDLEAEQPQLDDIQQFSSLGELQENIIYKQLDINQKGLLTTNWKLFNTSEGKIHFNNKKLEDVISYDKNDKDSLAIFNKITENNFQINEALLPDNLITFLEVDKIQSEFEESVDSKEIDIPDTEEDIPF